MCVCARVCVCVCMCVCECSFDGCLPLAVPVQCCVSKTSAAASELRGQNTTQEEPAGPLSPAPSELRPLRATGHSPPSAGLTARRKHPFPPTRPHHRWDNICVGSQTGPEQRRPPRKQAAGTPTGKPRDRGERAQGCVEKVKPVSAHKGSEPIRRLRLCDGTTGWFAPGFRLLLQRRATECGVHGCVFWRVGEVEVGMWVRIVSGRFLVGAPSVQTFRGIVCRELGARPIHKTHSLAATSHHTPLVLSRLERLPSRVNRKESQRSERVFQAPGPD